MKKWFKSMTGLALSVLLAFGLSGKVLADTSDENDPIPDPLPYEEEEDAGLSGDGDADATGGKVLPFSSDIQNGDDADADDDDNDDGDDNGGDDNDGIGDTEAVTVSGLSVNALSAVRSAPPAASPLSDPPILRSIEGEDSSPEEGSKEPFFDQQGNIFTLKNYIDEDLMLDASGSDIEIIVTGINRIKGIVSAITNLTVHGEGSLEVHELDTLDTLTVNADLLVTDADPLTLGTIHLEDANVSFLGDVAIDTVKNDAGSSSMTFHGSTIIDDIEATGTLTLYTSEFYADYVDDRNDPDDMATTITGNIGGNNLCLNSGIYILSASASKESGTDISYGYPLVYDYAGITGSASHGPLHVQPADALTGSSVIPMDAYMVIESVKRGYSEEESTDSLAGTLLAKDFSFDTGDSESEDSHIDVADYEVLTIDGKNYIDLADLKPTIDTLRSEKEIFEPVSIVEILQKDGEGNFSSKFYQYYSYSVVDGEGNESIVSRDDLEGTVPADDVYLIRITFIYTKGAPWGGGTASSTTTSNTGSGVLGGAGAGSVRLSSAAVGNLRVLVLRQGAGYRVRVFSGDREIRDLNGRAVMARTAFSLPQDWSGESIYAVFKNTDGSLTAFRAVYDSTAGTIRFDTDLVGSFVIVSMPFDGEPFSPAFYAALEKLPEVQKLLNDAL